MNRMSSKLPEHAIAELKKSGYSVIAVADQGHGVYKWMHKDGASQTDVKDRQPYRSSEAQAWADCNAYVSGDVPRVAEPDWNAR